MNNIIEKRKRIGFYYMWSDSWMGGVYYARNLLKALNTLDDKNKPYIDVYCASDDAYNDLKNKTQYPYLEKNIIKLSLFKKILREFKYSFCGDISGASVDLFKIKKNNIMLYPYGFGSDSTKLVYWKQDFQEIFLPQFFSSSEVYKRDRTIKTVAKRGIPIVFSSYDSQKVFNNVYSNYNTKTFVIHFAVSHEDFSEVDINVLKQKYGIKEKYLLCANQFWKHKNHLLLFKAFRDVLKRGGKFQIVCTGRMEDRRNPGYVDELKKYIVDHDLTNDIRLCGLVESKELYCLMKHSYAVVQPSLFEGWNTTVEDCKALGKFIFLSEIPVHKEQISNNVCFFNPNDSQDLANKILTERFHVIPEDYSDNMKEFGLQFLEVIKYMTNRERNE